LQKILILEYIGNDIINLAKALLEEKHKNLSWINKVFNSEEKEFIFQSKDPSLNLWLLWSVKESTYKLFVKEGQERFLNPKNIVIQFDNYPHNHFKVQYKKWMAWTHSKMEHEYIHTIASCSQNRLSKIKFNIFYWPDLSQSEGSALLRTKLTEEIKNTYPSVCINFRKNKLGIPLLNTLDSKLHFDISFTHDEPYFAYTYLVKTI